MTMARFPRGKYTADGGKPEWLRFIHEVNRLRHDTFGLPELLNDTPAPGYSTEKYPDARVVHAPTADEGVRVVADTDEVAKVFRQAAEVMGIHIAGP